MANETTETTKTTDATTTGTTTSTTPADATKTSTTETTTTTTKPPVSTPAKKAFHITTASAIGGVIGLAGGLFLAHKAAKDKKGYIIYGAIGLVAIGLIGGIVGHYFHKSTTTPPTKKV